jgi:hypothetical protein
MKEFCAAIDDHLDEHENGTITISADIEFSMRQTVGQTIHDILSKYMAGSKMSRAAASPFATSATLSWISSGARRTVSATRSRCASL